MATINDIKSNLVQDGDILRYVHQPDESERRVWIYICENGMTYAKNPFFLATVDLGFSSTEESFINKIYNHIKSKSKFANSI